jgi:hypothetical protein
VRWSGPAGGHEQLAGHPQVNHHLVSRVEREEEVFPTPVGGDDRRASQTVDDRLRRRSPDSAQPADLDRFDTPADDETVETPPDRLDLW